MESESRFKGFCQVNAHEHSFWLDSPYNAPFICYHKAIEPCRKNYAFVFCGPFAEEKNKSQRLLVDMARSFAGAGVDVLHLDYGGTGDSLGDFKEISIKKWKADILMALQYCKSQIGASHIGLLGLRLGGALAAEIAEENSDICRLILLSPTVNVPEYFRMNLRSKLVKEMLTGGKVLSRRKGMISSLRKETIDFNGFPITPKLYSEIENFGLIDKLYNFKGPVLIIDASLRPRISNEIYLLYKKYHEIGAKANLRKVLCEPFWNINGIPPFEKIINTATGWLKDHPEVEYNWNLAKKAPKSGKPIIKVSSRISTENGFEEVFCIDTPEGFLSCIGHIPSSRGKHTGTLIVFIHGWAGYRIGPHRMLVNMARKACKEGYLCLRIDVRGRGGSSGKVEDMCVSSIREDGRQAMRWVRKEFSPDKVVVLGQCQGGKAAFQIEHADGYIVWSSPPIEQTLQAKTRRTRFMMQEYLRKSLKGDSWHKLVKGQLNYHLIWEALFGHFSCQPNKSDGGGVTSSLPHRKHGRNGLKHCLFVYGENDPATAAACRIYKELCEKAGMRAKFHLVAGANHSFYSIKWENEVIDTTLGWLKEHFPANVPLCRTY